VLSLDCEGGVAEVWQLILPEMFSLITVPFEGKAVKVGVSNDHVI